MNEKEYITQLEIRIKEIKLKKADLIINKYQDMIAKMLAEGLTMDDVIQQIGSVEEVVKKEHQFEKKSFTMIGIGMVILFPVIILFVLIAAAFIFWFYAVVIAGFAFVLILGLGSLLIAILGFTKLGSDGAAALLGSGISLFLFGALVVLFPVIYKTFFWIIKEANSLVAKALHSFIGGIKNALD